MRLELVLVPVVGIIVAASAFSCSKKDSKEGSSSAETPPEDGQKGSDADDGDDYTVADSVPMALIGGEHLASVRLKAQGFAQGSYKNVDGGARVQSSGSASYPVASAIVATPGNAAGEMIDLLAAAQNLLDKVIGPNGFFQGKDVEFKAGVTERVFKLPQGVGPAFAKVRVNSTSSNAYRYSVELYAQLEDSSYILSTAVDFEPSEDRKTAQVRLKHVTRLDGKVWQTIATEYDTKTFTMSALFGVDVSDGKTPKATRIDFSVDSDSKSASILGAYSWDREAVAASVPRYYSLHEGDVEAFRARFRLSDKDEAVQEIAFIPEEQADAVGKKPGAALFTSQGYPQHLIAYVADLFRDPTRNVDCATGGDALRALYGAAGKTVPAVVQNLAANVCESQTAVKDANVRAALDKTCLDLPTSQLPITDDETTPNTIDLCAVHYESLIVKNPQYLYKAGGQTKLALKAEERLPEHAKVEAELKKLGFIDLAPLAGDVSKAPVEADAKDFAGAEEKL